MKSFVMLIGRILMSAIFLLAGVGKLLDYEGTAHYIAAKGLPMVPLALYGSAILEITCGLSLLFGYYARWGAGILFLYLIPVTAFFHNFWALSGEANEGEMIHFFCNLAIMGGLLFIVSTSAGKCSIDGLRCAKSCTK